MKEPLRQRKKARTAQAIEQAAAELFARQGFDATTLEQIAEAADIHKQTVLRYFRSKEDIAFAHRNRLFEEFARSLAERTGSVLEHWRTYILEVSSRPPAVMTLRKWFDFLASDDRLYAYQLRLNQRYQDTLAAAFAQEAGADPESDIFAHALAALLVSGNSDVARMTIRAGRDKDVPRAVAQVIDLAATLRREAIPAPEPHPGGRVGKPASRALPTVRRREP